MFPDRPTLSTKQPELAGIFERANHIIENARTPTGVAGPKNLPEEIGAQPTA